MLTDPPPTTHTPRKGAELQRGPGGQPPGLEDVAPPPFLSLHGDRPGLQAQPPLLHIRPPYYHGNKGQLGGIGMGQSTGLGRGSGCWGKTRKLAPAPLHSQALSPCPCLSLFRFESLFLSYLFVCLTLAFSLSHISLIRPLTFTTQPLSTPGSLCAPCLCPPRLHSHRWGEYPHPEKATRTGFPLLSAPFHNRQGKSGLFLREQSVGVRD